MRQSVKHITYTTMGLLELLSSIGEKVPSAKEFRENARIFMNTATFYGHGKFFHNEIIKTIKINYKQLQLEMVDESYPTKTCSNCHRMNGLKVWTGGHRYVYCSICHKGTHRDKNAAKNILLKNWFGFPSLAKQ
jgi:hypothetical protein